MTFLPKLNFIIPANLPKKGPNLVPVNSETVPAFFVFVFVTNMGNICDEIV